MGQIPRYGTINKKDNATIWLTQQSIGAVPPNLHPTKALSNFYPREGSNGVQNLPY